MVLLIVRRSSDPARSSPPDIREDDHRRRPAFSVDPRLPGETTVLVERRTKLGARMQLTHLLMLEDG